MEQVWNYDYVGDDARTVDVTVRRLREKVEADPANPGTYPDAARRGVLFREVTALRAVTSRGEAPSQRPVGAVTMALRSARVPCPGLAGAATLRFVRGFFPTYTPPGKIIQILSA